MTTTTWYRAGDGYYYKEPEAVEVVKEHNTMLTIRRAGIAGGFRDERVAKQSDHASYFPTFEEARSFMIARAETKIASLQRQIEREQEKLTRLTTGSV